MHYRQFEIPTLHKSHLELKEFENTCNNSGSEAEQSYFINFIKNF